MFLSINEAAAELKMRPSTIRRKIKEGLITAYRLGGSCSPLRIDPLQLRQAIVGLNSVRSNMALFDAGVKTPSEQMQYDELDRRCVKLATVIGPEKIFSLLKEFGAGKLTDLHPSHYCSFRGKLLRLSRGLTIQRKAA